MYLTSYLAELVNQNIDQLNHLCNQVTTKEKELVRASERAVEMYEESSAPPRELKSMIDYLQRHFQMAKGNINTACERLRKELAQREEAGLQLVTLLTSLQEAELALADPILPTEDISKARKEHDKLQSQLDEYQLQLMQVDVRQAGLNSPSNDTSEVLPDVLHAANQQLSRVQQLSELREQQLLLVSSNNMRLKKSKGNNLKVFLQ